MTSQIALSESESKRFDDLENAFYRIKVVVLGEYPEFTYTKATIVRKDTGESRRKTYGAKGPTRANSLEKLFGIVSGEIDALAPPKDWGKPDPVRLLINMHLEYKREIFGLLDQLNDEAAAKSELFASLMQSVSAIPGKVMTHTIGVARILEGFDESQRLRVVEASPVRYLSDAIKDAEYLDAITDLFYYIVSPSSSVISAHDRHLKKLKAIEDEWDKK